MKITNRIEFIEYCLRALGFPVIEINVDDDQIQDRIDDALQYYADFHFDGTERKQLLVPVTEEIISSGKISIPESMQFVTRVLPMNQSRSLIHPLGSPDQTWSLKSVMSGDMPMTSFFIKMQNFDLVDELVGDFDNIPIKFNRHTNTVHVEGGFSRWFSQPGDYVIVDGFSVLDPDEHPDVYNDRWLKEYATALIKRQWGTNLKKYSGIQLPGGATLDGTAIYEDANNDIKELEEEIQTKYSEPPMFFVG